VEKLRKQGHDAIAASRATGVDVITGDGLADALQDADIVIDTLNVRPGSGDMLEFFQHAGRVLTDAVNRAGVRHHIVLSALGADHLSLSGFFLAKLMQESLARTAATPYTILRAGPFFETLHGIATEAGDAGTVCLPPILMQPVAADDVVTALADIAASTPANRILELAGPDTMQLTELAIEILTAYEDPRQVVIDPKAPYFGAEIGPERLVAEAPWRTSTTRFDDWLRCRIAET
jgi:uncharacterized protein YbjT (DUF2867 family)